MSCHHLVKLFRQTPLCGTIRLDSADKLTRSRESVSSPREGGRTVRAFGGDLLDAKVNTALLPSLTMNEVAAQQLGNETTCPMLVLLSLHVSRIMLAQGILHSSHVYSDWSVAVLGLVD